MAIYIGPDYTEKLEALLKKADDEVVIFSAYIKSKAFRHLTRFISPDVSVSVISRWQKHDIAFGASDLEVYELCEDRGWRFGISPNLHGKLFLLDKSTILLGSANLTSNGLSLYGAGNIEFGVQVPANEIDVTKLDGLLAEVTWVDKHLYNKLNQELAGDRKPKVIDEWSEELKQELEKPIERLWISELSFSTPNKLLSCDLNDEYVSHDFDLFGFDVDSFDRANMIRQFKKSRLYAWLISQLKKNMNMNFGAFSSALHSALLDDPAPYRKKVKGFVANIFEWFAFLDEDFEITQYNRTSSAKLRSIGES